MCDFWKQTRRLAWAALLSCVLTVHAEEKNYLARFQELGLPSLSGKLPAYYSAGHREHAEKLQAAIEDMNVFFQARMGVQTNVVLALLDANDWTRVTGYPYSLPQVSGTPPVIFMPATSGSPAFGLMMARKDAIPPATLQAFLRDNHTTFEAAADEFVDLLGFHELGHMLSMNFGIDPQDHWLHEFLANYWSCAYISERQPQWKRVFDLLGRPSKVRPKNTSLEDFERLYSDVDDYGWYQGMFEARIREIYPELGLKFLSDLRKQFPQAGEADYLAPLERRMKPAELVGRLEKIAPGFEKWAEAFRSAPPASPPVAHVRPVTEDYYGTKVVDPYRYMENLNDAEVQAWMTAQNDYARAVLGSIPGREKLLARIRELDQSAPAQISDVRRLPGDLYFYQKLLAGEDVAKLYMRRGLTGQEKLLVDPEKVKLAPSSQGKGKNAIDYYAPSPDLKYLAFGIVPGGAERITELHVSEISSGHETSDVMLRTENEDGIHWLPDSRSFVYGQLQKLPPGAPASEAKQKYRSYLHVLGRDPDKDPAVFGVGAVPSIAVDPSYFAMVRILPGSRYAIGFLNTGDFPDIVYVEPLDAIGRSNAAWRKVADFSDGVRDFAVHGDDIYVLTFKNAPRFKIVRVRAQNPDLASAETVIPPSEAVITSMTAAQDALYVQLLDGGIGRLLRVSYGAKPEVQRVVLPFEGGINWVISHPDVPGALLSMTSWTKAPKIYAYDPQTKQVTDAKLQPAGPYDDPGGVESMEVKVRSYDGTAVPLSIVHPKGLKLDGSNPTHLEGYGAYGDAQNPGFFPPLLAFYERGGVYAVCHVRGGGEYGEQWHQAGKESTKPNTWRDFIACAEYLIEHKYTSPGRLSGFGASAGGILIGRAITERPHLFGAAIIGVGLLDMLRFETTENGFGNIGEFGSTKTEAGFQALYAMSAYHHVKAQTAYPAILLYTGINDPRVDPWEPAKMTARLQAATTSGKPVLLRVDYAGGHGGGSGEKEFQELTADLITFDLWQLGVPEFQLLKP